MDPKEALFEQILNEMKTQKGAMIPTLQRTQDLYGYLPRDAMKRIALSLSIPFSEVFGVATFYSQFRLYPRGRNMIRVCSGTACHVRGGGTVLKEVESILGIKKGETTEDHCFTLESVACLGACGLAPVMMVNEDTFGRLTKDMIKELLKQYH